jgi:glycosyltransferase involved in cell wall biosynthesis
MKIPKEERVSNNLTLFLVGSSDARCGVVDFTMRLAHSLSAAGVHSDVAVGSRAWRQAFRANPGTVFILNYPQVGMRPGFSYMFLWLLVLPLWRRPRILILHEYSNSARLRRCVNLLLLACTQHRLITTAFERGMLPEHFGRTTHLINVAGNLTVDSESPGGVPSNRHGVVYFGLIAPNKGLEHFAAAAKALESSGMKTSIVGAVQPKDEAYALDLLKELKDLNCDVFLDLPPERVMALLLKHRTAFLPYPDGASERRGSLVACASAGLPIITTFGSSTTPEMINTFLNFDSRGHDYDTLVQTLINLESDDSYWCVLSNRSLEYSRSRSWSRSVEMFKQALCHFGYTK